MSDSTSEGCFSVVFFGLLCFACVLGDCAWNDYTCGQLQAETGHPTKYAPTVGCLVQVDGQWVPQENWRATK